MKITIAKNKKVPSTFTQVKFIEKGANQLVRDKKIQVLEVVSGKTSLITPRKLRTLVRDLVRTAKILKKLFKRR